MREIKELMKSDHLMIDGKADYFPPECETYHGSVHWRDFHASVVFGYNENGMEHVSVSPYNRNRVPTWEEMCRIKDLFFREDEMVVQIHPAAERYVHGVNGLDNVLHLWRPKDGDFSILNHPERWD